MEIGDNFEPSLTNEYLSGLKFFSKGGESECFNIDVLDLNKVEDIVWSMT